MNENKIAYQLETRRAELLKLKLRLNMIQKFGQLKQKLEKLQNQEDLHEINDELSKLRENVKNKIQDLKQNLNSYSKRSEDHKVVRDVYLESYNLYRELKTGVNLKLQDMRAIRTITTKLDIFSINKTY